MPGEAPNILLVRFSSIGDLILTTPLIRALRARHPESRITFVVRADMAETLRNNPRIDEIITWERGTSLRELARVLKAQAWTHRLDLHGSLRSMALRRLVGGRWGGYPKHRVRRALLIRTHRARGGLLGHVADRYFAAAIGLDVVPDGGPPEFFTTAASDLEAERFLGEHGLGRTRALVALAPGAAHFTKRWPMEHWAALVRKLSPTFDLAILGGPAEHEIGVALAREGGAFTASAAGRFSLSGTASLLKRARALAAGDTGVLHLATAVGTPVAGLYGPTVEEFGFFPYHARAEVLQRDLPCRPCSAHGGEACPLGHHDCLVKLLPDTVEAAIAGLVR